jgi:hypothetical protein
VLKHNTQIYFSCISAETTGCCIDVDYVWSKDNLEVTPAFTFQDTIKTANCKSELKISVIYHSFNHI